MTSAAAHPRATPRLAGVDAARGVALLGMVATHVVSGIGPDGGVRLTALLFAGVSSALFVVLAGVGLALSTADSRPTGKAPDPDGRRARAARGRVLRRAGLLFLLGLLLGGLESSVAVILCHYALLFVIALPFLRLRVRTLWAWALGWLVLGPVAVFAVTSWAHAALSPEAVSLHGRLWLSPSLEHLVTPGVLLADLVLTGYYPVLSWAGFLLLGLAIGRTLPAGAAASEGRGPVLLLGVGGLLGAALTALSHLQAGSPALVARVTAGISAHVQPSGELSATLLAGEPFLVWMVPDPLWLVLVSPHGGGVLEALRAASVACAVLGACLLVARRTGLLAPLAAVGRVPLTLYAGHILVLAAADGAGVPVPDVLEPAAAVGLFWAGCLAVGLTASALGRRGPLEAAMAALTRPRAGR